MTKKYVVQQCFAFFDEGIKGVRYDSQAAIDRGRQAAAGPTTVLKFQTLAPLIWSRCVARTRSAMMSPCTSFPADSAMMNVCTVRFPTGAVGVFKLALHDGIARLLVDDGEGLHRINEMPVDPSQSTNRIAIWLLLNAAEESAHRFNHFDVLMRSELVREGLIDANDFRRLAARVAMRGVIRRAMDGAT